MQKTLSEIVKLIGGTIEGDESLVITGISGIKEAQKGDITFLANSKYEPLLSKTQASAVIVPCDVVCPDKALIKNENPSLSFAKLASAFLKVTEYRLCGVHPTAVIADDVQLGKDVAIGPHVVIESSAVIGNGSTIYSGCFIGHNTQIGSNALIYPTVTIRERVLIGNNVIIHSGTVIGCDGFGFVEVEGVHQKIPQVGTVVIDDDVEIGANVTIDRARFEKTFIGKGTKIDNLVQIAHNVIIGQNCIIVSQSGISGSTELKDRVVLAGQSGLAGHLTVGEGSIVGAQSGVSKSIPPGTFVFGYPAKPHNIAKRTNAAVQRLPEYIKTIQDMKRRLKQLEEKL